MRDEPQDVPLRQTSALSSLITPSCSMLFFTKPSCRLTRVAVGGAEGLGQLKAPAQSSLHIPVLVEARERSNTSSVPRSVPKTMRSAG